MLSIASETLVHLIPSVYALWQSPFHWQHMLLIETKYLHQKSSRHKLKIKYQMHRCCFRITLLFPCLSNGCVFVLLWEAAMCGCVFSCTCIFNLQCIQCRTALTCRSEADHWNWSREAYSYHDNVETYPLNSLVTIFTTWTILEWDTVNPIKYLINVTAI